MIQRFQLFRYLNLMWMFLALWCLPASCASLQSADLNSNPVNDFRTSSAGQHDLCPDWVC